MKLLIIRLSVLCMRILYFPMKKMRKTKDKIVWLSRQSDVKSEDMRLLSKRISELSPQTQQVFRLKKLDKAEKVSVSYLFSIIGDMWHLADSAVAICDTYSIPVSCLNHKEKLKIVQIWHALGAVKQFGLQSAGKANGRELGVAKVLHMHKNYDTVIAPSRQTGTFYREAFGCTEDKITVASLPRVDIILDGTEKKKEFLSENPSFSNKKLCVYLPTFRNGEHRIALELAEVFSTCTDIGLVVCPHPLSGSEDRNYSGDFSVYDLIKAADEIITDYSASAFEAALLYKPLWFYAPDYDDYIEAQGLNIDIKTAVNGAFFTDASKLVKAIRADNYDFESLSGFEEKYVTHRGTDNTDRLAKIICRLKDENL